LGNTGRLGTPHSPESIEQNRLNQPNRISVFIYDIDNKLVKEFPSQSTAANFLNCSVSRISRKADTGKRYRKIYLITTSSLP